MADRSSRLERKRIPVSAPLGAKATAESQRCSMRLSMFSTFSTNAFDDILRDLLDAPIHFTAIPTERRPIAITWPK